LRAICAVHVFIDLSIYPSYTYFSPQTLSFIPRSDWCLGMFLFTTTVRFQLRSSAAYPRSFPSTMERIWLGRKHASRLEKKFCCLPIFNCCYESLLSRLLCAGGCGSLRVMSGLRIREAEKVEASICLEDQVGIDLRWEDSNSQTRRSQDRDALCQ